MTDPTKLSYAQIARELLEEPAAPDPATPTVVSPGLGASQPSLPIQVTDTASPPTARGETRVLWRPEVPRKLGPYELLDEIGHGGMGIVYRARHEGLGTICAVKVMIAGEHASPESLGRFHREASAVSRMGKHPNIVTVYDLGREGSITYYAMELVDGKPLRSRMKGGPLAAEAAARIAQKVARALHVAHQHGIIHRDVKPENILVRDDEEPFVLDFGLARDVDSSVRLSVTGDVFGTPQYMAPEQVRGQVSLTGAWTDVYALGAVLYEMLTGAPAHPGASVPQVLQHIEHGEVAPPRRLRRDLPKDLEAVCMRCLSAEASQRYATAAALAEDLGRFLAGEPVTATRLTVVYWARTKFRRHRRVILAAIALVVLPVASLRTYDYVKQAGHDARLARAQRSLAEAEAKFQAARSHWTEARFANDLTQVDALCATALEFPSDLPRAEEIRRQILAFREHLLPAKAAWDEAERGFEPNRYAPTAPQKKPEVLARLRAVVKECDEALKMVPGMKEAIGLRAPARTCVGDFWESGQDYSTLLAGKPNDGPWMHGRARAYMLFTASANLTASIGKLKEEVARILKEEPGDDVILDTMREWLEDTRDHHPDHAAECEETLRWIEEKRRQAK